MSTAQATPGIKAGLKRLDELVKRTPKIAGAAAFYRAVIPALWDTQQSVPFFTLDAARAEQKLAAGRPLLVDEDLPLDSEATADLFVHICRLVEGAGAAEAPVKPRWSLFTRAKADHTGLAEQNLADSGTSAQATAARQIRLAIEQNQLELAEVWQAVAVGDGSRIEQIAVRLNLNSNLLRILAQHSLKPALYAWAQNLGRTVELDRWQHGHCPMCGNVPALSEIQGKEGGRRLRCSLCGTGWYYPRLQCAFCGRRGHKSLGYLAVEGDGEKYRVQTCESCGHYIKVVVTFDPILPDLLPVEDLATLHLDFAACERGFTRP
jgi:FdhE protein